MLLPCRLGGPGVARGELPEHEPVGIGHDLRLPAPATELVQEAEVSDLQEPRAHGAPLGIEPSRVPPDGQEDLLHQVFRARTLEGLDGHAEDQPREAAVQQPERLRGASGDLAHQLVVVRGVFHRSSASPAGRGARKPPSGRA